MRLSSVHKGELSKMLFFAVSVRLKDKAVVHNLMVAAVDIILLLTIAAGCAPGAIFWFVLASVGGRSPKN